MNILAKSCKVNKKRIFDDCELSKIDSFIILDGGKCKIRNNDIEYNFRQDSNFYWLTGINEPDYKLAINCFQKKLVIVPPIFDEAYLIWNGNIPDFKTMKNTFEFEDITFDLSGFKVDVKNLENNKELLLKKIEELRVIKNKYELKIMESACKNSQNVHENIKNSIVTYIGNIEKLIDKQFRFFTESFKNVTGQAYSPICAVGKNSSVLQYTKNTSELNFGELFLLDAGCEVLNYASDITRTFGIGLLNEYQSKIISIISDINEKCKNMVQTNVNFGDIYIKCMDLIYQAIISLNIIKDEHKDKKNLITEIFMPHGLGHFIGLDVHDVGGKLYDKKTGASILLKENMVITIGPGIYFNEYLLKKNSELWTEEIKNYENIGGVRIKDVLVVKKDEYEQLN